MMHYFSRCFALLASRKLPAIWLVYASDFCAMHAPASAMHALIY